MSLLLPAFGGFGWSVSNIAAGTQPAITPGTSFTCAQNTPGTAVSLIAGASVTEDILGLWINVNSINVATTGRQSSFDILIDPAGGSSWSILIPGLLGVPGIITLTGGISWYFPIYIKAGTSIGVQGSQNNASPGTGSAWVRGFGRPSRPAQTWCGTFVERIGGTSNSGGTSVTAGTGSEGSWTSLGSTTRNLSYWQLGCGFSDTNLGSAHYADLAHGDVSNKDIILEDVNVWTGASETAVTELHGKFCDVPAGATIYGRMQSSASETNVSMCAYGVGG